MIIGFVEAKNNNQQEYFKKSILVREVTLLVCKCVCMCEAHCFCVERTSFNFWLLRRQHVFFVHFTDGKISIEDF